MRAALVLAVLGGLPSVLMAGSIVCGNRIISRGSTGAELVAFCGEPAQVTRSSSYTGGTSRYAGGTVRAVEEIVVEIWVYNFGPNQLMERVRIENGTVVQIDSLGYGYNQP